MALMTMLVSACANVPYTERGSSVISYEEIWKRAESRPAVSSTLGDLGINASRPQQNMLSEAMQQDYSCRDRTIQTPKGRIDVALCLRSSYWRLPASTEVTFIYQPDLSEVTPLSRVIYLKPDQPRRWYY
jgi:hypothetical protein